MYNLLKGIFSSLLRLLATHFPHLCLVDDWMERQSHSIGMLYAGSLHKEHFSLTPENIAQGKLCTHFYDCFSVNSK